MIGTIIMLASLIVLGYVFNISSRLFWTFKSEKGTWKWIYGLVSIFVIATYFFFIIVTFFFITYSFTPPSILNTINIVVGIFFLSSSALIGVLMKHHLSRMKSGAEESLESDFAGEFSKEWLNVQKDIENLRKKHSESKRLKRLLVDKELKIIELSKKVQKLREKQ